MRVDQISYWLGRLGAHGHVPSWREIAEHTGCSRATAHRYQKFAADLGRYPHTEPVRARDDQGEST